MPSIAFATPALLDVIDQVLASCPAPALLVKNDGIVRGANEPARRVFARRLAVPLAGAPVRAALGLGWLELALAGREAEADLIADLPAAGDLPGSRGWRVRPVPVGQGGDGPLALVLFLEPPAETAAKARAGRALAGFAGIFGHDPALRACKEAAERFARTRLPILLLAETGTGKELLARAIHAASPRRDRAFVAINCGALSPSLLESELFGYAPGAFTGAHREGSEGKIGAARGGTLFLDEVAEMPAPLQSLLLRVLEDGTYYRVGDNAPRNADVRLICATCRDLPRMVESGTFRQDLFYRIDGACLTLPPLRARCDLPELTLHLLERLTADEPALGAPPRLEEGAFAWLIAQPWPGNVRQLKTALQHALVLAGDGPIGRAHLPILVDGLPRLAAPARPPATPLAATPFPAGPPAAAPFPALPAFAAGPPQDVAPRLAEIEAGIVRRTVDEAGGNLSLAARRLGIARTTLYRRLRDAGGA